MTTSIYMLPEINLSWCNKKCRFWSFWSTRTFKNNFRIFVITDIGSQVKLDFWSTFDLSEINFWSISNLTDCHSNRKILDPSIIRIYFSIELILIHLLWFTFERTSFWSTYRLILTELSSTDSCWHYRFEKWISLWRP